MAAVAGGRWCSRRRRYCCSTWLIDSTDTPAAAAADPADSTDVPV